MPVFWLKVRECVTRCSGFFSSSGGAWSGLLGPSAVFLKIDVHFSHGLDVAALGIVGELVAVDLVIAIMVAAIDHDVNIAQVGVAPGFELHRPGSSNGVKSAAGNRLGEGKAVAGLLNVETQRFGNVVQQGLHPGAGYPVRQR